MATDLFEKCIRFYGEADYARQLGYPTNPRMAQALGLYPFFLPIEQPDGPTARVDGRDLIMLGSNNYLGLNGDPRVKEAAVRAIERYGTSCTGSRFLNGTLELHLELEEQLASFIGKPKALVFSTGYQANVGALTALAGSRDVILCDKGVHASVIDGTLLCRSQRQVEVRFFRHRDLASLERLLRRYGSAAGMLVVSDGVFSMGGDVVPLADLASLCRAHGARLLIDDAHGIGVLGGGRGTASQFGCTDEVDVIVGTFSKSLASTGGFVASDREVLHWVEHRARAYMFTASLSPPNAAAALAALRILQEEPERVERVGRIADTARRELTSLGYDVGESCTPIVPIVIGDQFKTMQAWEALWRAGVYVNVALPPAVSARASLLRTSYMATHTDAHLDQVFSAFRTVRSRIGQAMNRRRGTAGPTSGAHDTGNSAPQADG